MRLRVIKHENVPNSSAANVSVANQIWQTGTVERYDSSDTNSALFLPYDSCGLQTVVVMNETTSQPMTSDSVLVMLTENVLGSDTLLSVHGDAISYFTAYQPTSFTTDTVPVFIVPYIGVELGFGGQVDIERVLGYTSEAGGALEPSMWLADHWITVGPAASVFAHEMGHLLLTFSIFDDNATRFINIMDYPGLQQKYRRPPGGFGLTLEFVWTTETNIRQLIEVQGVSLTHDQCRLALRPEPYVTVIRDSL